MNKQIEKTPSKIAEPASLKEARKRLGKTQAQIAAEVGLKNCQMIVQIESGRRLIPKNRVASFAKAYGVSNDPIILIILTISECQIVRHGGYLV